MSATPLAYALEPGRKAFITTPTGDVIGLESAILLLSPTDAGRIVPKGHASRVGAMVRVRVNPGHSLHVPGKPAAGPGEIVEVFASDVEHLQRTRHATIIGPVEDDKDTTSADAPTVEVGA